MSSPQKVTTNWLSNWFNPNTMTDEEKDANLFGTLAILEIALRVLYPPEANIKYAIENYRLHPQKIEDYQIVGYSLRWFWRLGRHDRNGLGTLDSKVKQFIDWYLLDNDNHEMQEQIKKLLGHAKEGFRLIAELPEYKNDNTGKLILTYVNTIDFALQGNYPFTKAEITKFGDKAKALLTSEDLKVIMNIFDLATKNNLKKESAIEQIETKMNKIQDAYIELRKSAISEFSNRPRTRTSINEDNHPKNSEPPQDGKIENPAPDDEKKVDQGKVKENE